jgi:hypothetical protein
MLLFWIKLNVLPLVFTSHCGKQVNILLNYGLCMFDTFGPSFRIFIFIHLLNNVIYLK